MMDFVALQRACRPLHIAVVQGDIDVVDRLLSIMKLISAPVDHFNRQRQVEQFRQSS